MFNTYNCTNEQLDIITEIPYFCELYFNDMGKKCKSFYNKLLLNENFDELFQCPYGFSCYKSYKKIYTSLIVKKHSDYNKIKRHLNDYKQTNNNFSQYTIEQLHNIIEKHEKTEEISEIFSVTVHDIKNATKAFIDLTDSFGSDESIQSIIKSNEALYTTIEGYGLIKYRLDYHDLALGNDKKFDNLLCNIVLHKILKKLKMQLSYRAIKKDVRIQIKGSHNNTYHQYTALYLGYFIILENAIKYANSGSSIEISINDFNNLSTIVKISNTCKIIYDDEIKQLGNKGFRSQNAKLTSNGSGLGLRLAKNIFEKANICFSFNYETLSSEKGRFEVKTIVSDYK